MITCQCYDYIEIACLYRFAVRIDLKNSQTLEGTARDTQRNEEGQECLQLDTGEAHILVPLEMLERMKALQTNPHFDTVDF